jgi:putative tricarboxylic transport membrane protein
MRVLESRGLIDVPMRLTNIPGKGGGNAWSALRQRARDPHVLAVSAAPLITNRLLGVSDFDHTALTPVATLYTEYLAFVVRADSPLRDGAGLLDRLSKPAGLTVAIATAIGTTNHIALAQVSRHAGADAKALELRVFDSALYAAADVAEGKSDAGVVSAVSAVQGLETGALRALAVSAPARMGGLFAHVPPWAERSVPCVIGQWRGIVGAPGITGEQTLYWEHALAAAVASPSWEAELEQHYWTASYRGSAETRAFLDSECAFLRDMLGDLGLTRVL